MKAEESAVVGLDAPQVLLDDRDGRDALRLQGVADAGDRRFVDVEDRRALRGIASNDDAEHRDDRGDGTHANAPVRHARDHITSAPAQFG